MHLPFSAIHQDIKDAKMTETLSSRQPLLQSITITFQLFTSNTITLPSISITLLLSITFHVMTVTK